VRARPGPAFRNYGMPQRQHVRGKGRLVVQDKTGHEARGNSSSRGAKRDLSHWIVSVGPAAPLGRWESVFPRGGP
jgi:hypothetical protein